MPKYKRLKYEDHVFVFKYDDVAPELLHIYARHLMTEDDAIKVWLEGDQESWNEQFKRFETFTETAGIYWKWLKDDEVVMVISCFNIN